MLKRLFSSHLLISFCLIFIITKPALAQVITSATCGAQQADVVLMLDRTSSIDRTTELPFEANAAKVLLDEFITLGANHKVAVGAFGQAASPKDHATILPGGSLTTSYASLKTVIDTQLNVSTSGTNIESAVSVAVTELATGANPLKFIVILSDGQANHALSTTLSASAAALAAAQSAKDAGIRIITIAYDSSDGSTDAIAGRTLLAAMASNVSADNTSGSIDSTERDLENTDGDDFYVAPSTSDLSGIFARISDSISCNDNNDCTLDECNESTRACSYTPIDNDGDEVNDCSDACRSDPLKIEVGQCGCGVADTDSDGDGTADCNDDCDSDPDKTTAGVCGCGVADTYTHSDEIADCHYGCSQDSEAVANGACGCGETDVDTDEDGTLNCSDECPNDSGKTSTGQCGCSIADTDTDQDGTADCNDSCLSDPSKTEPGICGCSVSDANSDEDETVNCFDQCPLDSAKVIPGACGCGVADTDTDYDGVADCNDSCATDPYKSLPGQCGCGVADDDHDADGTADCTDACINDPSKIAAGTCGCGVADTDTDSDGLADCNDTCPADALNDANSNGICDGSEIPTDSENPTPPETPAPDLPDDGSGTQVAAVVCDTTTDANADGRPDSLDPAFSDADGDGTPDCCITGGTDVVSFDFDGDGIPDCREFALGLDPTANDVSFQGSATTFSFGKCSLNPASERPETADLTGWLVLGALGLLLSLRLAVSLRFAKRNMHLIIALPLLLFFSHSVQAFNVQLFTPTDAVGSGYGLFTTQMLKQGEFAFGTQFNFVQHPLELGQINNDPRILGVVDSFITADLTATLAVHDHVSLTADMPINLYHNIAPLLIATRDQAGGDAGDLRLSAKIGFWDADNTQGHWGLSLIPFVTIPSGEAAIFFGNDGASGGAIVAGEKKFGKNRLYTNLGARIRNREQLGNLVINDELLYGVGYQQNLSEAHGLSAIIEAQGSTTFRKAFNDEISSPLEARGVLQKDWLQEHNLHSYVGAGIGLTNGYGSPDFRVNTGLSVTFPHKEKIARAPTAANLVKIVYFQVDKDIFYPTHRQDIQEAADFFKLHPGSTIDVQGHTDSSAGDAYNENLSKRRATHVMKALAGKGIPSTAIHYTYFGESKPVDTNDTAAGKQHNRRTEIQITVHRK